jgi:integrase
VRVFAGIQQRLDGFAPFGFRKPVPSLFDHKLLPNVVFGKTERRDRSAGFRCCFSLQAFQRIREQAKKEASADVKTPKAPAGRIRYLPPTELRALLEACSDGLRQIIALAVSTGIRRGEIINLRYLDVDMAVCNGTAVSDLD